MVAVRKSGKYMASRNLFLYISTRFSGMRDYCICVAIFGRSIKRKLKLNILKMLKRYISSRVRRFFRGEVTFHDFSRCEMHFPRRNFHFGRPQTNFSSFKKWQAKCDSFPYIIIHIHTSLYIHT